MMTNGPRRRRMILLQFKSDVPAADIDALLGRIRDNFVGMHGLRDLEMGEETSDLCDFTHAITFVLDDDEALGVYRDDEVHKALRAENFDLLAATVTAEIHLG